MKKILTLMLGLSFVTMWFAGGGVKPGTMIGDTDEMGLRALEPHADFHATILHLLGLDRERLWFLPQRAEGEAHGLWRQRHHGDAGVGTARSV